MYVTVHRFRVKLTANRRISNIEPLPPAYRAYGPAGTITNVNRNVIIYRKNALFSSKKNPSRPRREAGWKG